jgi:hypothetical protein
VAKKSRKSRISLIALTASLIGVVSNIGPIGAQRATAENITHEGKISVTWEPTVTTIAWTVSNEYDNVQVYDDGQLLASQSHSGEIQLRDVDSEEHQYKDSDATAWKLVFGASPLAVPKGLTPGYSSLLGCEKTQTAGGTR